MRRRDAIVLVLTGWMALGCATTLLSVDATHASLSDSVAAGASMSAGSWLVEQLAPGPEPPSSPSEGVGALAEPMSDTLDVVVPPVDSPEVSPSDDDRAVPDSSQSPTPPALPAPSTTEDDASASDSAEPPPESEEASKTVDPSPIAEDVALDRSVAPTTGEGR